MERRRRQPQFWFIAAAVKALSHKTTNNPNPITVTLTLTQPQPNPDPNPNPKIVIISPHRKTANLDQKFFWELVLSNADNFMR